jgi:hypothetical protein
VVFRGRHCRTMTRAWNPLRSKKAI